MISLNPPMRLLTIRNNEECATYIEISTLISWHPHVELELGVQQLSFQILRSKAIRSRYLHAWPGDEIEACL